MMRFVLLCLLWGVAAAPVRASQADDEYLRIFGMIEQADELAAAEKIAPAIAKYQAADQALKEFRRTFPSFNPKMVGFRLNYLTEQIGKLSRPKPVPEPAGAAAQASGHGGEKNAIQVRLLSAGAEPRTVLRFRPQPGDRQTVALTLKMASEGEMPGQPAVPRVEIPALNLNLVTEVKSVSEAGDIIFSVAYSDLAYAEAAGADPKMLPVLQAAAGKLSGFTAVVTNNSRGFCKGLADQFPPGADAQMRQTLEQMNDALGSVMTPLPEEAVGVGAKWETKLPLKSQGIKLEQKYVTELVGWEGERAKVNLVLVQSAGPQKLNAATSIGGITRELARLVSNGTGQATIDWKHMLPVAASTDMKTEVDLVLRAKNQKQDIKMKMDLQIALETK